jgi:uncharacterized OB-fold protein
MPAKKQSPAIEGLFTWPSKNPSLLASKCKSCGTIRFPSSTICNNPYCQEKKVGEVKLSRKGKVYSYMIEYYKPPILLPGVDEFEPYAVGWVELPEGLRVVGMMTQCDPEKVEVGMDVQLVVEKLYTDQEGVDRMTWKWKPIG